MGVGPGEDVQESGSVVRAPQGGFGEVFHYLRSFAYQGGVTYGCCAHDCSDGTVVKAAVAEACSLGYCTGYCGV